MFDQETSMFDQETSMFDRETRMFDMNWAMFGMKRALSKGKGRLTAIFSAKEAFEYGTIFFYCLADKSLATILKNLGGMD